MEKKDALRFNTGKIDLSYCVPETMAAISIVFMRNSQNYGGKYPDNNWRECAPMSQYMSSLGRHKAYLESGQEIDEETGLPHLWLMAANLQMAIYMMIHHPEKNDIKPSSGIDFSIFTKHLRSKE